MNNLQNILGSLHWPVVLFTLGLAASTVRAATTNVSFGSFFFNPKVVTIKAGDTVAWTLGSGQTASHTVTGTGSDSICGPGNAGSGCQHTFTTAGMFPYICTTTGHAGLGMTGLVQVVSSPVSPALLTNAARLPDGEFQFTVVSTANRTNIVQASTNLFTTNWISIGTVVPGSKNFVFTDTNSTVFGLRFYRVLQP